jgi:hypothetical protein
MWRNVLDLETDDITASELAVDGEIEHGEIACSTLDLQLGADRPDMLGSQWRLGAAFPCSTGYGSFLLERCVEICMVVLL